MNDILIPKKSRISLLVLLLFFISLMVRIEYKRTLEIDNPFRGDAYYYVAYAYNLVFHDTFSRTPTFNSENKPAPDAFCPPGFPFLVASSILIGGFENFGFYDVLGTFNALLGAMIAPMVFLVSFHMMPVWASFIAAILTTMSPHMLSIGGYVLTENLLSFVQMASLLLFILAYFRRKSILWGLSGFFWGLAYLVNPIVFFLPFILSGYILYLSKKQVDSVFDLTKNTCLFLAVFIVLSGVWHIRNAVSVKGASLKNSDRATINLINGLYPDYYDSYKNGEAFKPEYPMNIDIQKADGSIKKAFEIITEHFSSDPLRYLKWYLIEKPVLFWSWDIGIGEGDVYVYHVKDSLFTKSQLWDNIKKLYKNLNTFFFIIVSCGLILLFLQIRKNPFFSIPFIIYIVILYTTSIYSVFQADPRYSVPFRPEFYIALMFVITSTYRLFDNKGS